MTVRIGFLGAGLIATYHSKSLHLSGADVAWTGVFDPDAGRAERFAAATGGTARSDPDAVLDDCDAVYVCTPTALHPELVNQALARKLAVFCEKPLATTLESARQMADAAAAAGVTNQVGLVLRSSPAVLALKALVEAPEAGPVMSVVFRDDQYLPTQGMYASTWRGDKALAGAGTLIEHSIHDLDVLELIAGPIDSVGAHTRFAHGLDGIEDVGVVTATFSSGAVGTLTSIWHDVLTRPSTRRIEVFCLNRWVCLEGDWLGPVRWEDEHGVGMAEGADLARFCGPIDATSYAGQGNPDLAFVRAVAEGRPATADFGAAVRAHELVDAVYRSAADGGRPVESAPCRT